MLKILVLVLPELFSGLAGRVVFAQSTTPESALLPPGELRPGLEEARQLRAKGDYAAAEEKFALVEASSRRSYGPNDTFTARVAMDLGLVRYLTGDFRRALDNYETALAGFRAARGSTRDDTLECFYRTGIVLRELGDLFRAEDYIDAALAGQLAADPTNALALGKYHNALGNITLRQERHSLARRHYLDAARFLAEAVGENSVHLGALYSNLGTAYLNLDSLDQALSIQERALAIFRSNFPPDHPTIAHALLNLGEVHTARGELDQAEEFLREALDFWRKHLPAGHENHAIVRYDLAELMRLRGDGPAALRACQEALEQLAPGFDGGDWRADPSPDSVRSEVELMEVWTRKARALELCLRQDPVRFRLEDIFALYRRIGALADRMRRGYRLESSQRFVSGRTLPVFEEAIALAWRNGLAEEAFGFAEKSKGVMLYAALKGARAHEYAGVPQHLLRRESRQKERLVALNQELDRHALATDSAGQARYRDLIRQRFALEQTHQSLLDTFAREYPRYFELKFDHRVVALKEVQDRLRSLPGPATALLAYFQGDEALYGWAVSGQDVHFLRLADRQAVEEACDTLLARVRGRRPPGRAPEELYALAVAPLLNGLDTAGLRRLVVVRDGKLDYLPFALLRDGSGEWLIRRFAFSYASSATLAFATRPASRAKEPYLGLAMTFPGGLTLESSLRSQSLAALPFTSRETEAGQDILGGERLTDAGASEGAFRQRAGGYAILHLATHTLLDDQEPLYSRLLLHADDEGGDGFLHTYELFGLDLDAELVVLSACNTGNGQLQRGEGMMSLSRGFAYAGCPSVLMTHWTVSDRQSADLMADFFRGLADGLPKDEALRAAQLSHLSRADEITSHPWFWAAPGLLGDAAPLRMPVAGNGSDWWIPVLAGALLLAVVVVLLRRRMRGN